eukprot:GGOE01056560.1.p1 GENE.GGOE01056560.1~~GGOE01056560.1.p1  ORF type:complete len:845 (+),score=251.21 GGOE01056560.1:210-2537(+)
MAENIQQLLINQAIEKLNARLTEGDSELLAQQATMQSSGLLNLDLRPSRFDVVGKLITPYFSRNFGTMVGHPYFAGTSIVAVIYRNGTDTSASRICWISWVALYADIFLNKMGNRTLYSSTLAMAPSQALTTYNTTYVNQTTAIPVYQLTSTTVPSKYLNMVFAPSGWDNTLAFNTYSGQIQFSKWQWMPAQNDTWIQVTLSISAETISDELLAELSDSTEDRLVLFFRQPHGYMIGASHGKFYSHSDVDRRYINPLTNPPNLTAYHLWTCLQSNDALIQEACQQLYNTYQSWTAIPVMREETKLGGQRYWVATGYSSSGLQATVLMLKNRASVMGTIDAGNAQVDQSVSDKKGVTFIILGVISAVAVLLPLAVGLWLASRLYKLAAGMDRIAKLQFSDSSAQPTVFHELQRFQASFTQMERGLQAFGKFVPQVVVKVLIAGKMKANDEMHPEMLTLMFADIEGFSTICENVSPTVLVTVCTEYFEAMCSNIEQHNGTIDKFIGDCIMAMWNAPERMPGHEKDAVSAALAMQAKVMEMHSTWLQRGLPILKFRLGINTGVCLVGNFGCSYRVSYTCLGDGVNLAARLEPLNKKFGTYLCVSHTTYDACRNDFCFRKLGKVTVPGKTEVLPVYEVLCELDSSENTKLHSIDVPGSIEDEDVVEMLSANGSMDGSIEDISHQSPVKSKTRALPSKAPPGQVPYHWTYVDRTEMLQQARAYEQAYEAMVSGNHSQARQQLMTPLLDIPDKSWTVLASQLAFAEAGADVWNGVFYFREK